MKAFLKKFKNPFLILLIILVVTRLLYTAVGLYSSNSYGDRVKNKGWSYTSNYQVLNIWANWDSGSLLKIAEEGYPRSITDEPSTYFMHIPKNEYVIVYTPSILVDGKVLIEDPQHSNSSEVTSQLVLVGSRERDTIVNLSYVNPNTNFCRYSGEIKHTEDIESFYERAFTSSDSCGNKACSIAYTAFYSTENKQFVFKEYVTESEENILINEYVPVGFPDKAYEGKGCNVIERDDLVVSSIIDYENEVSLYPFMPLYSYLSKYLSFFTNNIVAAGLIISNISILLASYFLYLLVKKDSSKEVALLSSTFLLIWPFSFFFSGFLTEGLFIFLFILCIYLLRTKRTYLAILVSMFLPVTRILGILILPIFYYFYFKEFIDTAKLKSFVLKTAVTTVVTPLLLVLHSFYLNSLTGDYLVFFNSQKAWSRVQGNLVSSFIEHIKYNSNVAFFELFVLILSISLYLTFYFKYKKDNKNNSVPLCYSLIVILFGLLPVLTGSFQSLPRYSIIIFPFYIAAAYILSKLKLGTKALTLLFTFIISLFFMALWLLGTLYLV